jgi:hypothetical protein
MLTTAGVTLLTNGAKLGNGPLVSGGRSDGTGCADRGDTNIATTAQATTARTSIAAHSIRVSLFGMAVNLADPRGRLKLREVNASPRSAANYRGGRRDRETATLDNVLASAPDRAARDNLAVADCLRRAAVLLAAQDANAYRVAAYRHAADAVEHLDQDLRDVVEAGGQAALDAIPGIGRTIAAAIMEMLITGRWAYLERLQGTSDPEALFSSVPGIGMKLARRLHETLQIDSLETLEAAAHDGRLRQVSGFSDRRVAAVRAALHELLDRVRPAARLASDEASVVELLDADREYRAKATSGTLHKIAPRRFNPSGEAWLPVLHTVRGPWHFTVLWSNTAQARELSRTGDWVVVYFHRDMKPEGRRTVVTETSGPERGHRVVRGREAECRALAD